MHHHGDHGHGAHGHHHPGTQPGSHPGNQPGSHHGHHHGGHSPERGLSSPVGERLERSDPGQPQRSPEGEGCPKRGGTASCSRECRTCQYGGGAS
jgi:hypothetical protein